MNELIYGRRQRRYTADEQKELIRAYINCDDKPEVFCAKHNISISTLNRWKKVYLPFKEE